MIEDSMLKFMNTSHDYLTKILTFRNVTTLSEWGAKFVKFEEIMKLRSRHKEINIDMMDYQLNSITASRM